MGRDGIYDIGIHEHLQLPNRYTIHSLGNFIFSKPFLELNEVNQKSIDRRLRFLENFVFDSLICDWFAFASTIVVNGVVGSFNIQNRIRIRICLKANISIA